jgi:methionyl-tRNA synthetase
MSAGERFYITTPIYYVNDSPHIGHAYTTLACDAFARFARLDGKKVWFLTGTDEHGQKVEKAALAAGKDPQAFTDEVSQRFRRLADAMGFSHDDFIRTTEPRHYRAVQHLWNVLVEKGEIYLGKYAGWYSVRDEAFFDESEITDGKAPTGAPVDWVEEPSYFFRLSAWQDRLLAFYEANPDFILPPSRRNEVVSFVKSNLRDLSVSRTTFKWGVPVPNDPDHVMYVWLDALTNYITALGYPDDTEAWRTFWPADVHVVGKDILRFHAIYWPAFLMAADLPPPKRVFAHGWWTNEGHKISKSVGNVIDPLQLIDTYGLDQTRYFLLREVPFGADGDFSRQAMARRMNADLANDYGNLGLRVLSFIQKNAGAAVPRMGELQPADHELLDAAAGLVGRVRAEMEVQAPHKALEAIFTVIADANRWIDTQAPWTLRKTDQARMNTVLWVLVETIRRIAILTQPFMPTSSARVLDQLAVPADRRQIAHVADPAAALVPGTPLPKPEGVFPKWQEPA